MAKYKVFKKIIYVLLVVLVIIQFIRPEKNVSGLSDNDISKAYPVPSNVKTILNEACMDCHSNTTAYPWYSNIQPVAWWLKNHVDEGKGHLNFNEFTKYRLYRQYHKLEEIDEVITSGEMPMNSYTWMHPKAKLDESQKDILISWSKALRDSMEARYPADSLKKK